MHGCLAWAVVYNLALDFVLSNYRSLFFLPLRARDVICSSKKSLLARYIGEDAKAYQTLYVLFHSYVSFIATLMLITSITAGGKKSTNHCVLSPFPLAFIERKPLVSLITFNNNSLIKEYNIMHELPFSPHRI